MKRKIEESAGDDDWDQLARRLKEAKNRLATEGTTATIIKEGLCRLGRNGEEIKWIMTGRGKGVAKMKDELRMAMLWQGKSDSAPDNE